MYLYTKFSFSIMIYNERELRTETVRTLAEAIMAAARTAPKAKGRDLV